LSKVCSVKGCNEPAIKTISVTKFEGVNLEVEAVGRKIYLCKKHYKEYKKQRKNIERLERWRWSTY